jgi:hypothetical protein
MLWFFVLGFFEEQNLQQWPPWKKELKENIRMETANIPAEQLQRVNQNLFRRCEECLCVDGQHYQHHLWSMNCKYFIPNVIGLQAYWFIGKIGMYLATSSAPVAVKSRAVNCSTKTRTSLWFRCRYYKILNTIFSAVLLGIFHLPVISDANVTDRQKASPKYYIFSCSVVLAKEWSYNILTLSCLSWYD